RETAAKALGRMGPIGKAALVELSSALKDAHAGTRAAAAEALGHIGPDAAPAQSALVGALRDADRFARRYAAFALGRIGPKAQAAVPDLAQVLTEDTQPEVRRAAAEALAQLGAHGAAVSSLAEALKDKDVEVRRSAANALSNMERDAKSALPSLQQALKD